MKPVYYEPNHEFDSSREEAVRVPQVQFPTNMFWDRVSVQTARRGWEVWKGVTSQCHNLSHVKLKQLENRLLTTQELEEYMKSKTLVEGLPNRFGYSGYNRRRYLRYLTREDAIESNQKDKHTAIEANNGALPPCIQDLMSRQNAGLNQVFSFLCAQEMQEPPEGSSDGGAYFNPQAATGAIMMPRPLYDGMIEYKDGTPASTPQMAADVTSFLIWLADEEHDFEHFQDNLLMSLWTWMILMLPGLWMIKAKFTANYFVRKTEFYLCRDYTKYRAQNEWAAKKTLKDKSHGVIYQE